MLVLQNPKVDGKEFKKVEDELRKAREDLAQASKRAETAESDTKDARKVELLVCVPFITDPLTEFPE